MKTKIEPSMTWEQAPDTIGPEELGKILGIGEPGARSKFDEKGFPRIPGLGNLRKADKEAARLYIQGINIKANQKEAIIGLLLFEIKKLNTNLESKSKEVEEKCELLIEENLEMQS